MLVDAFRPHSQATVTLTAGAAAVATPMPRGEVFEVQNAGTGVAYFEVGEVGVVADPASATPVLPGAARQFRRHQHRASSTISVIAPAGGGAVYVTGGTGTALRVRGRGGKAIGPSGPVAIFDAPLTTTLVPKTAGDPTFTFTRATTAYVQDCDGILRNAAQGEARFQGARRVRNLLAFSNDFTNAAWSKVAVTVTPGITGPLGLSDASTLTATGFASFYAASTVNPTWTKVVASCWMRRRTGTGTINLVMPDAGSSRFDITAQLTASWKRFTVSAAPGGATVYTGLDIAVSGDAVDIAYFQTEDLSGAANQAPSEYVSVGVLAAPYQGAGVDGVAYKGTLNGNSVAANVVTEAAGVAIPAATLLGYVAENQATNLCLQSQTFDDANWTKSDCTITPNAQTAPDGSLAAETFTDNASNAFHRVATPASISITVGPLTFSVYLKAGTLTWAQLLFYDGGVTKWANFNLAAGTVGNVGTGVTGTAIVALPNGWYRCSMTGTVGAFGGAQGIIYSSNANVAATPPAYVGSGQTMYLWGAQVEQASDASSYIPTTSAAVTRNVDDLRYPVVSNIDGSLATTYIETYSLAAAAGTQQVLLLWLTGLFYPQYYETAKTLGNYSAAGVKNTANTRALGAVNKNAVAWSGATVSVCLNGGAIGAGAFTAYTNSGQIVVGVGNLAVAIQGSIRNVRFYATRLTDAALQSMTS